MRELRHHPLASMTTLGLGGPAPCILDVFSEQELQSVLIDAHEREEPVLVLGGGSNVIVDDAGWPGWVIRPLLPGIRVEMKADSVVLQVGAGEVWDELVRVCVEEGWSGLACLSGIPGWVGASPIQNIGAYGHDVGEVLESVRVFDRRDHRYRIFPRSECNLGYRTSLFRHRHRYVVSSVTLRLPRDSEEEVKYPELAKALGAKQGEKVSLNLLREKVLHLRRSKGMVLDEKDPDCKSAGSYFVNPVVDSTRFKDVELRATKLGIIQKGDEIPRYEAEGFLKVPAAWLIERAGFSKGMTQNGVGISSKHALALVNHGGTAHDLLALENAIVRRVQDTFGLVLSREPVLVDSAWAHRSLDLE